MTSLRKWESPELNYELAPSFTNLVENFFGRDFENFFNTSWKKNAIPAVNIYQTKEEFKVEVAAPGLKKEDFKIEVDDNFMTISASSEMEKENKTKKYTRKEYSFNSFSRSFELPTAIKGDKISANYVDGVLKINIPKSEMEVKKETKTKMIPVS